MTRKRLTERQVLECLVLQGAVIPCGRCLEPFTVEATRKAEREHIHELALGGADDISNAVFSHQECHAKITNGTSATTAGSSKHRIAKTQGNRAEKFAVNKLGLDQERPERPRFGNSGRYMRRER